MTHPHSKEHCPFCFALKGIVRRVSVKGDHQTFTFECEDCKCTWQSRPHQIAPSRSLFAPDASPPEDQD